MDKILWVKFGWSEYYRGEPVDGNFGWLNDNKGQKSNKTGHEAFNFLPAPDGRYYVYVPPQSGTSAPSNPDQNGWTVVCLAKNPKYPGVHIVGWFEDATLLGDWKEPPEDWKTASTSDTRPGYDWSYCITSDKAFFVPPQFRNNPFSDTSVRQGKYSFLAGPNLKKRNAKAEANKARVLSILKDQMKDLRSIAVKNPDAENPPAFETDEADPLVGFGGTAEQRKKVEKAAERAVIKHYSALGYEAENRTKIICGYDFCFTKGRQELHVEVKGTSGASERFFLTRNEYVNGLMVNPKWHLAMVTSALSRKPIVKILTPQQVRKAFELEPICYEAIPIPKVKS